MKKFWKRFFREFEWMFRIGILAERFARFQAYRMNNKEMSVIGAQTANGGCFLYLRSRGENLVIWVSGSAKTDEGRIKVKYHREPEEKLITIYGRHEYRSHPTAYLRVA
ncbi:MAG: hypothetical protein HY507_01655 [Candidatus Zambryskibacteria bacterium]|nr:hypothetical protein [Candidatus Zambryskibacteria bacterium]